HDDGLPRLPRDLRRHLDDLPVLHEGAAGEVLTAGLPGHRNDRVVLALRRSGVDHPVHDRLPDLRAPMETTQHKLPNYMLIWLYLFVLTAAEVLFAFEMPISQLAKIVCLLVLAVVKALLVALFFMHLKFERWRLRVVFMIPLPLAAILNTTRNRDRKSTRLNSSHLVNSYAVFCLKKNDLLVAAVDDAGHPAHTAHAAALARSVLLAPARSDFACQFLLVLVKSSLLRDDVRCVRLP